MSIVTVLVQLMFQYIINLRFFWSVEINQIHKLKGGVSQIHTSYPITGTSGKRLLSREDYQKRKKEMVKYLKNSAR